jgi:hypothetical protein
MLSRKGSEQGHIAGLFLLRRNDGLATLVADQLAYNWA